MRRRSRALTELDELRPPDLWNEISRRVPRADVPASRRSKGRVTAVALASLLSLATIAYLARSINVDRTSQAHPAVSVAGHPPPSGPAPSPRNNQTVPGAFGDGPPQPGAELIGVDATAPTDVWAVGEYHTSASLDEHSFVEHWDGSSWQRRAVPDVGRLIAVTAITPTDAWAIGYQAVLHWDGSAWTIVHTPNGRSADFGAVSASGSDDVWIVGTQDGPMIGANTVGTVTFAMHWDGTSWQETPTPDPSKRYDNLHGVVALGPSDAWAAGYVEYPLHAGQSDNDRTLVLHWNGRRWTTVPSPNASRDLNVLWGMGTDGAGGVWAVGHAEVDGHLHCLFLRSSGSAWRLNPSPAKDLWSPTALSGTSAHDVWAVGSEPTSDLAIAHWDGRSWTILVQPGHYERGSFTGVVAVSPTDAWAVGVEPKTSQGATEPRIEHWNGERWETVASPSF